MHSSDKRGGAAGRSTHAAGTEDNHMPAGLESVLSGLLLTFYSVGGIIGPLVAGPVTSALGFRTGTSILALVLLAQVPRRVVAADSLAASRWGSALGHSLWCVAAEAGCCCIRVWLVHEEQCVDLGR